MPTIVHTIMFGSWYSSRNTYGIQKQEKGANFYY